MDWTAIGTVMLAIAAMLGLVAAVISWFFKRGADEREMTVALKDVATASRELASEFRDHREYVVSRLHDHDLRFERLEASRNGSAPAHRNACSPG